MDHSRKENAIPENEKVRVFLDANVLFSASDLRSRTAETLRTLIQQNHEVVTNSYAWGEVWRNVSTKCPHWLSSLERFRDVVEIIDASVNPVDVECVEKDIPILAGAIGAQCTHLWTGDKAHFGKFYGKKTHGVTVVSSILLAELLANG